MPKLFGTSGIRGPAETLFTKEFCVKLGVVFGTWLKNKGKSGYVAVAMDPRDSSPRIKDDIIAGLSTQGWEILDEGVIPTPALTYFVKQSPHVGGGVMITGSHITANLNGVKLFIDGEEVTKAHEAEIEKLFGQLEFKSQVSSPIVKAESAGQKLYVQMLTDLADLPYPKWKIVLDTANGAQSEIMRAFFEQVGLEFSCTDYCDIQSPHFVPRDTENQGSVTDLMREVLLAKADLGIAFDADGDRVVFVDDQGQFLPGDYTCTLIAASLDTDSVVTPINTSSVIDHIGKKVYRTQVGSTNVALKMKEVGAMWGFEANGGGISAELFYGRDGASTMVKLLNLLKVKNQSLSALYNSLPRFYLYRDKVDCPVDKFPRLYQAVKDKYQGKKIEDLDGVKVYIADEEWLLFRASGNAPEFRVFVQSPDKARSEQLGHEGIAWVKSLIGGHNLTAPAPILTDSLGIKASLEQFPQQFAQVAQDIAAQAVPAECNLVKNIVLAGMGGSALAGRVVKSLEQQLLKIPFEISTEFHLPAYVDNKSLVIISSYSGNTEETLSALQEALQRHAAVYILSSGGKLAEVAQSNHLPAYVYQPKYNPAGQPRMGLGYSLAAVLFLLARCQLIPGEKLSGLADFLTKQAQEAMGQGQDLAQAAVNHSVVLMASEHLVGSAHVVKNMLNENAKNMAVMFDIPEANHHLLEGLSFPKSNPQNYFFVMLKSTKYRLEVLRRYAITAEVIGKQQITVSDMPLTGDDHLQESVAVIQTGAWWSYHLATLNHVDPGPIPWVDYFKDQL